ncbi:hypothetical protein [Haloechinothrix sp. LS1_15]|uniref:hypothetical protein n=1 Tax=Haloechinothrix sp. LS1_15 TaxID=2652248 RepID=UPI0029472C9F|nr:hypothetical protein [Haloechinothrix sp. LS1_15]MDV6012760.1 hypothetical protein [Haloechinothrix sp. LS1_15]
MRVMRIGDRQSRVTADVRAALTAFGRGDADVGGLAIAGLTLPGDTSPIEGLVVRPNGIFLVFGVDLADPTMRLVAPLNAPWTADGWPVAAPGADPNPATRLLASARVAAGRLRSLAKAELPVGVIIAVGPYAHTVEVPDGAIEPAVHILYPTPASFRAVLSKRLPGSEPGARPCTVEQARAVLRGLLPETAPPDADQLVAEGFGHAVAASARQSSAATPSSPEHRAKPVRVGVQRFLPRRRPRR